MSGSVAIIALGVGADQRTCAAKSTTGNSKLAATHLVAALAGLLGLAGYVYVLGGLALYIELYKTGIPAGEAIDEFTSRRYLVVGLPIALIVGGSIVGVVGLAAGISWLVSWRKRRKKPPVEEPEKSSPKPDDGPAAAPRQHSSARPLPVLLAVGGLFLVLCMAVAAIVWPPISLRQASVTTQNGECITGAYISTDGNGVNLASGKTDQLRTVPTAEVVAVVIGKRETLSQEKINVTRGPCA